MKTGICTLPLIPLRSESSERSEMISQILFGELVEVIEENDSWIRVRILSDNYSGWCTKKMVQILPEPVFKTFLNSNPILTENVLTSCIKQGDTLPTLFLPAGSRLYFLDPKKGTFPVFMTTTLKDVAEPEKEVWTIDTISYSNHSGKTDGEEITRIASLFMNAPYLWGGKSILGIDCSGLVQVVFSILGLSLPRDASDQALLGERISDLSKSLAGDLAFFANPEGKVVHVGLLMGDGTIIHSSGCVHVDRMDHTGIFSKSLGKYTHHLFSIKRIISSSSDR